MARVFKVPTGYIPIHIIVEIPDEDDIWTQSIINTNNIILMYEEGGITYIEVVGREDSICVRESIDEIYEIMQKHRTIELSRLN